jgi:hypothetical protein
MELKMIGNNGAVQAKDEVFARDFNEALVHQLGSPTRRMRASARGRKKTAARSTIRPRSPGARRAPGGHAPE